MAYFLFDLFKHFFMTFEIITHLLILFQFINFSFIPSYSWLQMIDMKTMLPSKIPCLRKLLQFFFKYCHEISIVSNSHWKTGKNWKKLYSVCYQTCFFFCWNNFFASSIHKLASRRDVRDSKFFKSTQFDSRCDSYCKPKLTSKIAN